MIRQSHGCPASMTGCVVIAGMIRETLEGCHAGGYAGRHATPAFPLVFLLHAQSKERVFGGRRRRPHPFGMGLTDAPRISIETPACFRERAEYTRPLPPRVRQLLRPEGHRNTPARGSLRGKLDAFRSCAGELRGAGHDDFDEIELPLSSGMM